MKVAIIDSGGNVMSLKKILNYSGFDCEIINSKENIKTYDTYILPGIGSFDNPINRLKEISLLNFFSDLKNFKNKKLIGICSGMQILFKKSEEGVNNGLNLIPGEVKKFDNIKFKIPHMGWNQIHSASSKFNFLEKKFYFAHSYYADCDKKNIVAECKYGITFPAIVNMKNIWGIQFHPEKSHLNGIELFKTILE